MVTTLIVLAIGVLTSIFAQDLRCHVPRVLRWIVSRILRAWTGPNWKSTVLIAVSAGAIAFLGAKEIEKISSRHALPPELQESRRRILFLEDFDETVVEELCSAPQDRGPAARSEVWMPMWGEGDIRTEPTERVNNWALCVHRERPILGGRETYLRIPIDGNALRGKTVELCARVKGLNITQGPLFYQRGGFNLALMLSDGDTLYLADRDLVSSFQWRRVYAREDSTRQQDDTPNIQQIRIPDDVSESMILNVGLQNCEGSIWFDWIAILDAETF